MWEACLLRQRKDLAGWTVLSVFTFSIPRAGLNLLQAGNSSYLDKYCTIWGSGSCLGTSWNPVLDGLNSIIGWNMARAKEPRLSEAWSVLWSRYFWVHSVLSR